MKEEVAESLGKGDMEEGSESEVKKEAEEQDVQTDKGAEKENDAQVQQPQIGAASMRKKSVGAVGAAPARGLKISNVTLDADSVFGSLG